MPRPAKKQPTGAAISGTPPHRTARRTLPAIERPAEVEYPLVYRQPNKHPRNNQSCREVPLVRSPEDMIAVRFADGTRLVVLRRHVHELDSSAINQAGREEDRKFWGTR
jgi:hypothetical protein